MLESNLLSYRKAHARTLVDDQLATQVGFLFVAFHEKFFSTAIQFPVDMTDGFSGIVKPMLGKLHRKAMKRAFMQTRNETFDNLSRQKLQTAELRQMVPIDGKIRHDVFPTLYTTFNAKPSFRAYPGIPCA